LAALIELLRRDDGRPVLVGLSGGMDSTALLHACTGSSALRASGLRAIHVHHGLHCDADAWTTHCERICTALDVPLTVVRVVVAAGSGNGPEAAARDARHAAFNEALREDEVLALAHHRDDQAETFLLRALRASGPDGLAAMRPWRRFGRGWLWRPLLELPRARLQAYASEHGVHWIEDPSNADTALDRNFLRQRVLPLLRERWPHADAAFARSAALNGVAVELLEAEDMRALLDVRQDDPATLIVSGLLEQPAARRARMLRRWIVELGLPPLPAGGVARIEDELLPASADRVAEFAWHGAVIHRWRDLLHAGRHHAALPGDWRLQWDGRKPARLPDGSTLALEGATQFDTDLLLAARQGGERITLPGRAHSHALKHALQDLGVPPWVRERLPLLTTIDGEVLAAGDLLHAGRLDTWLRDHGARLVWTRSP
jgi:tRNA(Ile)-lysidine synthase